MSSSGMDPEVTTDQGPDEMFGDGVTFMGATYSRPFRHYLIEMQDLAPPDPPVEESWVVEALQPVLEAIYPAGPAAMDYPIFMVEDTLPADASVCRLASRPTSASILCARDSPRPVGFKMLCCAGSSGWPTLTSRRQHGRSSSCSVTTRPSTYSTSSRTVGAAIEMLWICLIRTNVSSELAVVSCRTMLKRGAHD